MEIAAERVRVRYTVQVPHAVLQANARLRPGADPVATTTSELLSGLLVLADGERMSMVSRGGAEVRRDDDAHVIALDLEAAWPPKATRLEVSNGNLPEVATVASTVVWVGPDLLVRGSSLLEVERGRVRRDDSGRWVTGDQGRRITVDLARRDALPYRLARWLTHTPDAPVPLAEALLPGPAALLQAGRPIPPAVALALLLAAMLGATAAPTTTPGSARGPARRRPSWKAAAAVVAGIGLSAIPLPSAWAPIELAAGLCALVAAFGPAVAAWVGVAALTGALHAPRLALALALVAIVAARLPLSLPTHAHRAVLAVTGGWLALRGILGLVA